MEVLAPLNLTPSMVTSSVAENEYPAYTPSTVFAKDARCIYEHYVYESLVDSNTGNVPSSSVTSWVKVGPTVMWGMFDDGPASATTSSGAITVILSTANYDSLVLLGVNASQVTVQFNGVTVANVPVPVPEAPAKLSRVLITGLTPTTGTSVLTVVGSGPVTVSNIKVGKLHSLGMTAPDAEISITDYSVKKTDSFGVTRISRRAYSRKLSGMIQTPLSEVDRVNSLILSLRTTVCYWIANRSFEALAVLGFYRDWGVDLKDANQVTFGISIEGLAAEDTLIEAGDASQPGGVGILANYTVVIESTNGTEFRVGEGAVTLMIAHVFNNGEEVTGSIPESWFRWRRVSRVSQPYPNDDATWNATYASNYKQVLVTVDDVMAKATFHCDIVSPDN